jgi:NAD(P)-dependent dehydrogenase (short-subunit alcohol dehydrogenase family)
MAVKEYTKTVDGIEMQFAANHVGHFLLTNLLIGKIFAAGSGARIVNVSSGGHVTSGVRFDDWNFKV